MGETQQREVWVDNVKVVACILVVAGHFYQSMVKSNIVIDSDLYCWFDQTIYFFHVPLFFICSGYLYQNLNQSYDLHSWCKNIKKKALNLGIPYLAFSFLTWSLKTIFAHWTNEEVGGLMDSLFVHPIAPYWYLYALFFVFLITPWFQNRKMAAIGLMIALVMKTYSFFYSNGIPGISYIITNEIWFVLGMCLSIFELKKYFIAAKQYMSIICGMLFLILSIAIYKIGIINGLEKFLLGFLACFSIIAFMIKRYSIRKQSVVFKHLAKYTMPIFLMHTLFAAPCRIVLFKLGVQNSISHILCGIMISFLGPVIADIIMKKIGWMEIIIYPEKYIKIK